ESFRSGKCRELCGRVPLRKVVLFSETAIFGHAAGGDIRGYGGECEKDLLRESWRKIGDEALRREHAERQNVRRPLQCTCAVHKLLDVFACAEDEYRCRVGGF